VPYTPSVSVYCTTRYSIHKSSLFPVCSLLLSSVRCFLHTARYQSTSVLCIDSPPLAYSPRCHTLAPQMPSTVSCQRHFCALNPVSTQASCLPYLAHPAPIAAQSFKLPSTLKGTPTVPPLASAPYILRTLRSRTPTITAASYRDRPCAIPGQGIRQHDACIQSFAYLPSRLPPHFPPHPLSR